MITYSILEIRTALRTYRSNSAPGSDGIKTRVLQLCMYVYADDIAVTCDTIDQAENVFRRLEMNTSNVVLKINLHAGHNSLPRPVTAINGYPLEICYEFLHPRWCIG